MTDGPIASFTTALDSSADAILNLAALWLAIRAGEADVPHDDHDAMAIHIGAYRPVLLRALKRKYATSGWPVAYMLGGLGSPEIRVECAADSFRGLIDGVVVHEFRDGVGRDVDPGEATRP